MGDTKGEQPKKTKVYKKQNDCQTSFCGETVQTDEGGKEFFELPPYLKEQAAAHSNLVWPEAVEAEAEPEAVEEKAK